MRSKGFFGFDYYKAGDEWRSQFPRNLLSRLHLRWPVVNILAFKNWPSIYRGKGPYRVTTRSGAIFETAHKARDLPIIAYIFHFKEYGDLSGMPENATVIDLGGHVGSFSVSVLKENPTARVCTYEPSPESFSALKRNIALNGLEDRCTIFQKAVAGVAGPRTLYMTEKSSANTLIDHRKGTESVTVQCTTLDDIFSENHIETCELLKMDIEGAEFETLSAASDETLSKVRNIILEWHQKDGLHGEKDVLELLRKRGFSTESDVPSRNLITAIHTKL